MSSEDLESLIVSDESLLDPSVDTSRLRRTTDTRQELLGDLQPGLQYDPTLQSTYSDLLRYFSGDLDIAPAPVSTVTTPTVGSPTDEGGGGGGTIGTGSGGQETGGNTEFEQSLIDQGVGVQIAPGQPVVAPGEIPVTQAEIDAFNAPSLLDSTSTAEQIAQDLSNQQAMLNPTGGNIMDEVALTGGTPTAIDPSGMLPQISNISYGDPNYIDGTANTGTIEGQQSALSQAFRTGKEALDSGMQTISQVGQSIADSVKGTYNDLNRTVNVPGLGDIDVGKTLGGLAINAAVGAPISLVKYVIDQIPPSASQLEYEGYTSEQQAAVDEAFGPGGSMEGYNAVSAFGTPPAETIQNRIDSIRNRTAPQTTASENKIKELQKDYNKITSGSTITGPNIDEEEGRPEDIGTEAITADDAFGDYDGPSVDTGPVGPQFEDPGYADPGVDCLLYTSPSPRDSV